MTRGQPFCMTTFKILICDVKHDDVIKWKHFPGYWPFERGIHRSPVNSWHKGQRRGALIVSLICVWINCWVNNREAGDLRRHRGHYGVTGMTIPILAASRSILMSVDVCHLIHSGTTKTLCSNWYEPTSIGTLIHIRVYMYLINYLHLYLLQWMPVYFSLCGTYVWLNTLEGISLRANKSDIALKGNAIFALVILLKMTGQHWGIMFVSCKIRNLKINIFENKKQENIQK